MLHKPNCKNYDKATFKISPESHLHWQKLNEKIDYPNEYFNSIDFFKEPVDNSKKEDFFSKLKIKCPSDEEVERIKEIIEKFEFKNGEEITKLHLKSDVILLACVFEKFTKTSIEEYGIILLY